MSNPHRVSVLMGLCISYPLVREHRLVQHVMVKGRGVDGERMSKGIFSNNAQSCVIVFPSCSYSNAK